jgi:hypothetical protein
VGCAGIDGLYRIFHAEASMGMDRAFADCMRKKEREEYGLKPKKTKLSNPRSK